MRDQLHGKRFRRFFLRRSDAEAVAYKLKHDAVMKRFGLPIAYDRELLSDLVQGFADDIRNPREQTRARRVLADFCEVLTPGICVDEVTKADAKRYVDKRMRDGLKPQTVNRELNIIVAMFNKADSYFSQLDQWRPPRMPRPKVIDGRRERIWSEHEIKVILGELFAPKREDELVESAIARYQVGRKVQFALLNGLRHSEMNLIPKTGVNWDARQVRIRQGKTGNYKVIGSLGPTSMEILREFSETSKTDLVFSRSGNIAQNFTRFSVRLANVPALRMAATLQTGWYFMTPGTPPQLICSKAILALRRFKRGWVGPTKLTSSTTHTPPSDRGNKQDALWKELAGHIPQLSKITSSEDPAV